MDVREERALDPRRSGDRRWLLLPRAVGGGRIGRRTTVLVAFLLALVAISAPIVLGAFGFTSNGITLSRTDSTPGAVPYDYAPSVMVDGSTTKMWWLCGEHDPSTGFVLDTVCYATKTTGAWSTPTVVLRSDKTNYPWEGDFLGDPSVVKGSYAADGNSYTYALYYGAADVSGQGNDIGVAFSNDGVSWHKYSGNPVVSDPQALYDYGTGLPSAYSTGGANVTLAYFDHRRNGQTFVRTSTDAKSFAATTPYRLPFSGTELFADIAYSQSESRWYLATKNQVGSGYDGTSHSDSESYIFRSNGSSITTQEWALVGRVDTALTGYRMNHNAGWFRNTSGDLYYSGSNFFIAYGAQTQDPNNKDDPQYWDIGQTTITGSFDSVSAPGAFTLSAPSSGSVQDPLEIPTFSWSSSTNATSYVITISELSSLPAADSDIATPIISTIHATSYEGLKTVYDMAQLQGQALRPGKTYYWSVRATNSAGSAVASNGPWSFTTTDSYRWRFDTGVPRGWHIKPDGQAAQPINPVDGRATVTIQGSNDARNVARRGADYGPIRAELDTKTKLVVRMKNSTSATKLRVYWKLQDDPYFDAFRSTDFNIVPNDKYFREYVFNMAGQTGWGTSGKFLAWLRLEPLSVSSGQYELDDIQIVNSTYTRENVFGRILRVDSSASSTYSAAYPSSNATDGHDATFWISTTHSSASNTEYLTVDAGKSESITSVSFTPRPDGEGSPVDFTIEVSPDLLSWATVVNQTAYGLVTTKQTFTLGTPVTGRYVRLSATKLRAAGSLYLLELAELAASRDTANQAAITNSGFEDGLTNWTLWSSGADTSIDVVETYGIGTLSPVDGSNSYAAVFDAGGTTSGSFSRTVSGLTANATYKVMVWAAGGGREARLVVRNYGGAEVYQTTSSSSSWTLLTQTVTLGATNTSLEVHLYGPASGSAFSYAEFDNVEVVRQ